MAEDRETSRPSEQELADRMREELTRLKVADLLVQTLYTTSSLGYHKLSGEARDLVQARLAIEAMRALLPVLKDAVPPEVHRDFGQVVANLQLAYADAVAKEPPPKRGDDGDDEPAEQDEIEPDEDVDLGGEG